MMSTSARTADPTEENDMAAALRPETPTEFIARMQAHKWPAARILAGAGHPGYSPHFAREVIAAVMATPGLGWHAAIARCLR